MVTDEQVRLLMAETRKGVPLVTAAAKSGMTAPTARKWQGSARNPSEVRPQRVWRTRQDPFQEHWPEIEQFMERDPSIGAKTVFEWLVRSIQASIRGVNCGRCRGGFSSGDGSAGRSGSCSSSKSGSQGCSASRIARTWGVWG